MTAAEVLEARAEARGEARGVAKGKAELVMRMLRLRFGEVLEAIQQRVLSASSTELDSFADRILTVDGASQTVSPQTVSPQTVSPQAWRVG